MYFGEMAEWSIAFDLKSKVLQCTVSSNLTPSFFEWGRQAGNSLVFLPSYPFPLPKVRPFFFPSLHMLFLALLDFPTQRTPIFLFFYGIVFGNFLASWLTTKRRPERFFWCG